MIRFWAARDLISWTGGDGSNTLTGGKGADHFQFTVLNIQDGYNGSFSDITDFKVGTDIIELSTTVFTGLGAKGELAANLFQPYDGSILYTDPVLLYNKGSGSILYFDGNVSGVPFEFATVVAETNLVYKDFLMV